ncbi:MAG: superoxide dismutase family protein [Clostridia bacterium]|nr:superoxide dismutase family protein [Clostridia bacterium]
MFTIPHRLPDAAAVLSGSAAYPSIRGLVRLYQTRNGVLVVAEVRGLPAPADPCQSPVFGFHIHIGDRCSGNEQDPFADALTHYDPDGCPHPHHAGDLPPLFGNRGTAFSAVLTDRFTVRETLGRTVIIHSQADDFTTQPTGNAGTKIACGVILPIRR